LDRMLGHVPVLVTLRAQLVTECDIYQLGAVIVNMTVFWRDLVTNAPLVEGVARPFESACALRELKAVSIHAFW
jgi:hypothetical protein